MPSHEKKSASASAGARKPTARRHEFALMCGSFVDSYYASNREALAAACRKYLNSQFSILRVKARPKKARPASA